MENVFDLTDRVVVVTGATGILGSHYCRWLAAADAKVVVADLDLKSCTDLAGAIAKKTGA